MLFSDAHERFRAETREIIERELTPHADEWEAAGGFPVDLMPRLGALGWFGMSYPCDVGGRGLDFGYDVVLGEELPRSKMFGLGLSLVAQAHFVTPLLLRYGTAEQKQRFAVPTIQGQVVGALAVTEPSGGSDVAGAAQCSAVDDGDSWIVNGDKKFITNAPIADFVVTLVRTRPESTNTSLSLLIIPTDTPGFRRRATLRKLGMHTSPTGWIEFEDCRVPKDLTLGKPNLAFFYVTQHLLRERLIAAITSVSFGDLILKETITYVQQRAAYGGTLSDLQSLRHRLAELAADVEMGRRFAHSVAERFRDGHIEAKEICMMKFRVVEMMQRLVESCLQMHGGYGYLEENWLTRAYRDVRMLTVGGGASELMKDLVAGYLRV